jgi:hypothetical protein
MSSFSTGNNQADRGFVLTGILRRGELYVAFVEDTRSGTTLTVSPGALVSRGRAKTITLDYMDYQVGSTITRVKVGSNLTGATAETYGSTYSGSPSSSSSAGSAGASANPPTTTEPASDQTAEEGDQTEAPAPGEEAPAVAPSGPLTSEQLILQRLRQRREQQLR